MIRWVPAALVLAASTATAAPSERRTARPDGDNVILHAVVDQHDTYSDIWGYTAPDGREFALLGAHGGVAVIDITDRRRPRETAFVPGPASSWRDIKMYLHYMYVVNEGGGGLQIVSLANPEAPAIVGTGAGGFTTAHNLYIDESAGMAYIAGRDRTGGLLMLRLTSPAAPTVAGSWDSEYAHDVYVKDHLAYVSAIYAGRLFVLDVSVPNTPVIAGVVGPYPGAFTHNAWTIGDGSRVLTTDEHVAASVRMWDISDLSAPSFSCSWQPPSGRTCIPHNVHVKGTLAFASWYTAGVRVLDVSDPNAMTEVAWYDTHPTNDANAFQGCWGVFPFYPASPGLFVASDIARGLFVLELEPGIVRAAPRAAASPGAAPAAAVPPAAPVPPAAATIAVAVRPNPARAGEAVRLVVPAPRGDRVCVEILDPAGRRVRRLEGPGRADTVELTWDGRDGAGRRVAPGTYFVRVPGAGAGTSARVTLLR